MPEYYWSDEICGAFYATQDFMSGVKTEQNIRTNALRVYDEYIADGLSPEDAFMKTSTGFIMQNDRLPTIYRKSIKFHLSRSLHQQIRKRKKIVQK